MKRKTKTVTYMAGSPPGSTRAPNKKITVRVPVEIDLNENHHKALRLLTTSMKFGDVAAECGFTTVQLGDLYLGRPARDPIVALFQSELRKNDEMLRQKIKRLIADTKIMVLEDLNSLVQKERANGSTDERVLVPILNALAKASGGIEVTQNIQNNVFNSMTSEEIVHEFRRLTAITVSSKAN